MLNSVVLPAPFGPMTAKIVPGATLKLTLSTASRPRKRLLSPSISSSAVMAIARLMPSMRASQGHTPSGSTITTTSRQTP